jgi:DNA repair protein RecN (Recombination protein N)
MLKRLRVHDLAILDHLELALEAGLVVFTGETGAGKSIIIDAIGLVIGGKADPALVRAGAEVARAEAEFDVSAGLWPAVRAVLEREGLDDDDEPAVSLAREVRREGRSQCRVNGRQVSLAVLREIGELLVDVHGQGEHLSLLRPREHVFLLDRYAGLDERRQAVAAVVRQLNALRQTLGRLRQSEQERERRLDMLNFQIAEIESARLKPGEEATLQAERNRLANAEKLAAQTDEALAVLVGDDEHEGASDLVGRAARALSALARIDPAQAALLDTAQALGNQVRELSAALETYRETIEFNPKRLDQLEERHELIKRLQRKYGERIDDILAFAERAVTERETLSNASVSIERLMAEEGELLAQIGALGAALSAERKTAGKQLAKGIERELQDLKMEQARFGLDLQWTPAEDGALVDGRRLAFDSSGLDRAEFLIAPNPGEGLRPLVKIASGGETARLMLALKGVLAGADQTPTLIFDEIDQGIGGRVGGVVGQKLWALTGTGAHQVLCITHLPQLAAYGDQHYRVEKRIQAGRTTTRVVALSEPERATELSLMLGGTGDSTRAAARDLLANVAEAKAGVRPKGKRQHLAQNENRGAD